MTDKLLERIDELTGDIGAYMAEIECWKERLAEKEAEIELLRHETSILRRDYNERGEIIRLLRAKIKELEECRDSDEWERGTYDFGENE